MDDAGLKRLTMRSWRRGMRETDLLLGGFADERLESLDPAQRADYEALLEENDHDLYAWITARTRGEGSGPPGLDAALADVASFAAARSRRDTVDVGTTGMGLGPPSGAASIVARRVWRPQSPRSPGVLGPGRGFATQP